MWSQFSNSRHSNIINFDLPIKYLDYNILYVLWQLSNYITRLLYVLYQLSNYITRLLYVLYQLSTYTTTY